MATFLKIILSSIIITILNPEIGNQSGQHMSTVPNATTPGIETIKVEVTERGVATVSLFRPEAANARNQQMRNELAATWRWIAADPAVTVVVLTATGDRHFCAGMDLKEASGEDPNLPIPRSFLSHGRHMRHRTIEN